MFNFSPSIRSLAYASRPVSGRSIKPDKSATHIMGRPATALRMNGGSDPAEQSLASIPVTPEQASLIAAAAGPASLAAYRPTLVESNIPSSEWSKACLESFPAREYRAPFLLRNRHVNTIGMAAPAVESRSWSPVYRACVWLGNGMHLAGIYMIYWRACFLLHGHVFLVRVCARMRIGCHAPVLVCKHGHV
jgi:hypothetical protein